MVITWKISNIIVIPRRPDLLLLSHSLAICNAKVSYLLWDSTQMLIQRRLSTYIDKCNCWQNQPLEIYSVQFLQTESFLFFLNSDFDKFDSGESSLKMWIKAWKGNTYILLVQYTALH